MDSELIKHFVKMIESGMNSRWAYKCCIHFDEERYPEILQLKADGMQDEYIYNSIIQYNSDVVRSIRKLLTQSFDPSGGADS